MVVSSYAWKLTFICTRSARQNFENLFYFFFFAVQTKHVVVTTSILIMCSLTHFNIKVWVGGFPFFICGKTSFALPVAFPSRGLFCCNSRSDENFISKKENLKI